MFQTLDGSVMLLTLAPLVALLGTISMKSVVSYFGSYAFVLNGTTEIEICADTICAYYYQHHIHKYIINLIYEPHLTLMQLLTCKNRTRL
jgi:hypothetical protein